MALNKAADRAGVRFVVIAGEEEREADAATVKDLSTGTQERIPRLELAAHLHGLIGPSK